MLISYWSSDVCSSDLPGHSLADCQSHQERDDCGGLPRGNRGDDDRIFHRAIFFELADDLCDGRALLADSDIDAIKLLRFVGAGVGFLLVDEGVDRDGGLAGLAIADDQFALAAADGNERVERLESSEEHTSELQSLMRTSYAVFCLKKNKQTTFNNYK